MPATQNEPEGFQVLRLPRKTNLRSSECCACHAKQALATQNEAAPEHHSSPDFRGLVQVLRLPRKTSLKCSKCCACHAKRTGDAPSAAPATPNEVLQVLRLPRKTRRRPKSSLVAGLPRTFMKVLQVLRLPRKMSLRCSNTATQNELPLPRKKNWGCSKCCACHAKRSGARKHHSSPDFREPL